MVWWWWWFWTFYHTLIDFNSVILLPHSFSAVVSSLFTLTLVECQLRDNILIFSASSFTLNHQILFFKSSISALHTTMSRWCFKSQLAFDGWRKKQWENERREKEKGDFTSFHHKFSVDLLLLLFYIFLNIFHDFLFSTRSIACFVKFKSKYWILKNKI